jgi:endo-1,4-beta-mannosidase
MEERGMKSNLKIMKMVSVSLIVLLAMFLVACGGGGGDGEPAPEEAAPQLSPVKIDSTGFTIDGKPFRFIGANSIYFGFYDEYGFSIEEAIRTARENEITVIRIYLWLGNAPWGGRRLEEYDKVLDIAARHGVYVIVTLTDCCPGDWGSTPETYFNYVPHCNLTSPSGLTSFKSLIKSILTRRNTVNGKIYRDDTTIFAWDIANELQLYYFDHSDFHDWLGEVTTDIKELDANHLITIGISASHDLYDSDGPQYEALNVPGLDFFSFHFYPSDRYAPDEVASSDEYLDLLRFRVDTLVSMGKPVVLEEFGFGSQREWGGINSARGLAQSL